MDLIQRGTEKGKRKHTVLPLLIVLFVISYSLLTKLVIEQDKTIDSQRSLIHLLFADNISLSTVHKHATKLPKQLGAPGNIQVEFEAPGSTGSSPSHQVPSKQAPSSQVQLDQFPSAQVQSSQVQSSQVQSNQVPSTKTDAQGNTKTDRRGKRRRAEKPLPAQPPVELTDPSDMRRVSFSI